MQAEISALETVLAQEGLRDKSGDAPMNETRRLSGGRGCVIFRTACPGKAPEKDREIFCEKETRYPFTLDTVPGRPSRPDPARSAAPQQRGAGHAAALCAT